LIVNSKPMNDLIKTKAASMGATFATAKENGAADLVTKYKAATEFNATSYDYSNSANAAASAATAGSDTQNLKTNLNGASVTTDTDSGYSKIRTAMDAARATYNAGNTQYTTDSWNAFTSAYSSASALMAELPTTLYSKQSDASDAGTALSTAYAGLKKRADFSQIDAAAADSKYNNISPTAYTYTSYKAIVAARKTVQAYSAWTQAVKDNTAYDDEQTNLNNAVAALENAYNARVPVEEESYYETYDAIIDVVESELSQTEKYNTTAHDNMESALNTANGAVYHTVTADEASDLGVAAGTKLKDTPKVVDEVTRTADYFSGVMLTALNNVTKETSSYNSFSVRFVIVKDNTTLSDTTTPETFGAAHEFSLGSYYTDDDDVILWQTETYDDENKLESVNKIYGGSSITKIINSNVVVTANITSKQSTTDYIYKIYNGNGKLVSVEYYPTSDVTEFEDAESLVALPFYKFTDWYISVDETSKTVTVKAVYDELETVALSAYNGTFTNLEDSSSLGSSATVLYDIRANISYTGSGSFYAWAVKVGSKYTVVSYNSSYDFYTQTALEFVPIVVVSGSYVYELSGGNVNVTAATIASTPSNLFGKTADQFVTEKLTNKAPFIAVVGTAELTELNKHRAFVMVTEPLANGTGVKYTRLGIKFSKDGTDPASTSSKAISSVLPTGQFTVSLNGTTTGAYRATVNYDYNYMGASFDVCDTSDLA
ncbi:MAG: hypothetical protein II744_06350, partial [Eubacterium sp.]|nr:hypothetical protein [Eubacterium sp.]